jgi:hypothetical protein
MDADFLAGFDIETASAEELRHALRLLLSVVGELRAQVSALGLENQRLREELAGRGGPPSWVRPNRSLAKAKEKQQKERKRRAQSFARKREEPTRTISHALDRCPDCGQQLSGGWEHSRRQVIDLPTVAVEVIEHVIQARYCGVCGKRQLPRLDLGGVVLGRHRIGIGLMSLIGCLRLSCRLPRRDRRRQFETALGQMAYPYMDQKGPGADPRTVLAKRLERFAGELFLFVEDPDIPSDNNPAERAIRPTVILRKIVGGTRSEQGSKTLTTLASLYGTWQLVSTNVIQECRKLLDGTLPIPETSH